MSEQRPQTVADARLSHALSCWQRWRRDRDWPTRADIDPDQLRLLLPNIFIVEAIDGGRRFRYVLAGATVRNTLGFELSGCYVDELFSGEQLARGEAAYHLALGGQGHSAVQRWMQHGQPVIRFRRLLLPLASDRQHIDTILGFALYDRLSGNEHQPIDHIRDPVTIETEQETLLDLNRLD